MPRILIPDNQGQYTPEDQEIVFRFGRRINAGDAAAILWASPFESAYGLWQLKTGRKPRAPQTDAMRSGLAAEPVILQWYEKYKGINGIAQAWGISDEADYVQGKADFWAPGHRLLAEFKAPTRDDSADHALARDGTIPAHYKLQCLHLMEVFDAQAMDFVSWRSADDVAVIPVQRDSDYWLTVMWPAYAEFWDRIQRNEWPEPTGTEYQQDEEWARWARQVLDCKAMAADVKVRQAEAEAVLKRMASAKTTIGGGIRATWSMVKPRWEIVVTADSEAARDRIYKVVQPLEGRDGVRKLGQRSYPPNLMFRISAAEDKD